MYLTGRNLEHGLRGDDVRSLHDDLALLGYLIPDPERVEGFFGDGTRAAVVDFQRRHRLRDSGVVDEHTARAVTAGADPRRPRVVRGQVTVAGGTPRPQTTVAAFDKDVRSETELGRTVSGDDGGYQITYTAAQFRRPDKGGADLVVRALGAGDREVLAASPIVFAAKPVETVDLVVPGAGGGPSELERYLAAVDPVRNGVPLADLRDSDIEVLAGQTRVPREHLALLVDAVRHEAEDARDPAGGPARIPAAAYYGWFRQGLPGDGTLWNRSDDDLTRSLRAAVDGGLVPRSLRDLLPALPDLAGRHRHAQRLRPVPPGMRAGLGDLLGTMPRPLNRQQQVAVAAVVAAVRPEAPDFGDRLQAAGLSRAEAVGVHRTLRLDEITLGHAALVRSLQDRVAGDEDASLRSLATLPTDRWLDLAYAHGAPPAESVGAADYAARLEGRIEELHPSASLAARLATGRLRIARPGFGELGAFLADNPSLDVLGTPVEDIADQARFTGVDDKDRLLGALTELLRLKALSTTWQESAVLLNAGLASADDLLGAGRDRVEKLVGDRIDTARLDTIYATAAQAHDMSISAMVATLPRFSSLTPAIGLLSDAAPNADPGDTKLPPTLRGLFGDLDVCECRHCGSVLSPAAYLVDLLEFVKPNPAAFGALLRHRPDLLDLELSCENTTTELPHLDLVLETLENAVALPHRVVLPVGTDAAAILDAAARETATAGTAELPHVLTAALGATALDVPDRLAVSSRGSLLILHGPSLWTVSDRRRRWALQLQESGFFAGPRGLPALEKLPIPAADAGTTIAALDTGGVPAALRPRFEAFLIARHPNDPVMGVHSYQIDQLEPGHRWKVTYTLSVRVLIERPENQPTGTLTLLDPAGGVLLSDTYSQSALRATATALDDGRVDGLLPGTGLAKGHLVTADATAQRWTIESGPYQLELRHQAEVLTIAALAYQSCGPDADLLAAPENRNPAAYRMLRTAEFPWSLPFDLPLTEIRAFLDRLDLPRRQLVELVTAPADRLADDAVAREVLGLSDHAANLTAEPATADTLWRRWGLSVENGNATVHDAATDKDVTGTPAILLSQVSIVARQAGLDVGELRDVLQTRFVRGTPAVPVTIEPTTECAPSKMTLHGITAGHLDRIHRFVRLWRALGWPVHELDLAIAAVQPGAPDGTVLLRRLSHVKLLHERLGLPVETVAAWWGGLGTPVYTAHTRPGQPEIRTRYDRLFQNPLVSKPLDLAFRLNPARTALAAAGSTIGRNAPLVCAALGVPRDDLQALTTGPARTVPDDLTLDNLSTLHGIVTLSRALGITATAYPRAVRLTGIDPLTTRTTPAGPDVEPDRALDFCAAVGSVHDAGLTVDELAYVLRHESTPGLAAALGATDDPATAIAAELRADLQAARSAVVDARASLADRVRTLLTRAGWAPSAVEALLRDLGGQATAELPDEPALLGAADVPEALRGVARVTGRTLETLDVLPASALDGTDPASLYAAVPATTSGYAAYALALDGLAQRLGRQATAAAQDLQGTLGLAGEPIAPEPLCTAAQAAELLTRNPDADARYSAVLDRALERELRQRLVTGVARAFDLDEPTTAVLLFARLHHPDDPHRAAGEALLDRGFLGSDARTAPDRATFPAVFTLVRRLHKVALLVRRLELPPAVLREMPALAVLDLNAVPTEPPSAGAPNLFDGWRSLAALARLTRRGPGAGALIAAYAAALAPGTPASPTPAAVGQARQALADGLDLTPATVADAATQLHITGNDHRDPRRLEQLLQLLLVARRTGATPAHLATLAATYPDEDSAESAAALAREVLHGKHDPRRWHDLLRPISDALRERQRDALVDHLLARDGGRDADDLYGSALIDVRMAPCQVTTRILQATAAVQLFVQRWLLNLERDLPPGDVDRARWEWMRNYRVWEANRKVFLYPENWLLPELRDDRTQAFRELEGNLGQSEPSHERAAQALAGYLDELSELGQITVVGLYEDHPARVVYAVGRSPNQPYRYYWRRCDRFGEDAMQWSGWERIDVEIPGDHVLPFVFEGDLHVAWPVITRQGGTGGGPVDATFEARLAWVRRTGQGWSRRKVSRDPLATPKLTNRDERSMFAFRVAREPGPPERVEIRCWVAVRDPSLDLTPGPETSPATLSGGVQRLTVNLFTSYFRYDNPTAYEYATGVTYEGQGFQESSSNHLDTLVSTHNDEWYQLPSITARRAGTFLIDDLGEADLKFRAKLPDGTTVEGDKVHVEVGRTVDCVRNFVFPRGNAPARLTDAEVPLKMRMQGAFVLASGGDVEFESRGDKAELEPLTGTYLWMSGHREVGAAPQGVSIDGTVFKESKDPDRFLVLPSGPVTGNAFAPAGLWYFQEARSRFYLDLRVSQNVHALTVYPDSYPESGTYRRLAAQGLPALFAPGSQATMFGADQLATYLAGSQYQLENDPRPPQGRPADIGFLLRMPYANYHWELFVHAPLRIADELARQQRFEDALRWLHFLFDPTTTEPVDPTNPTGRFWKALPLRRAGRPDRVTDLLAWLLDPEVTHPEEEDFRGQITVWAGNPFRPHAVARLRHGAYQWRVLFSYLDVLIAWGDQLFRYDTRESVAEATQLYVLAARILGPRPRVVSGRQHTPALSYRSLAQRKIEFADAWLAFADTSAIRKARHPKTFDTGGGAQINPTRAVTSLGALYFCVPHNDKLVEYWDTVEDRLFKVRHCQNFDGVARELALWEPPIDPEILVRATAAGVDIAAVLADRGAALAPYRFTVLAQKAGELCAELKSLGAALLAALEKRDAEELALLRSSHEVELLTLAQQIKQHQIDEADSHLEALRRTRTLVAERYVQYQRLLGRTEITVPLEGAAPPPMETLTLRPAATAAHELAALGLTQREVDQLYRLNEAQGLTLAAGAASTLGGLFFVAAAVAARGGKTREDDKEMFGYLGRGANIGATVLKTLSDYTAGWATKDAILAGYERRRDDWAHQSNQAARELAQIDKQIAGALLRFTIATEEFANHQRHVEQSQLVDEFLREKHTSTQLYGWMVDRLAGVYGRTYQLAHEVAKRAERAFQWELGVDSSRYIGSGHWDSLKRGLVSGEHLYHDVKRLEVAYLEQHRREFEITRHVSLLQVNPMALIALKEHGSCEFELPEALFDLDFPGHYFRRIKTVGLSVPCVVGPYTSVNATLTLLRSTVRHSSALAGGGYPRDPDGDDPRFTDHLAAESVATSGAQNDAGVFELTFHDERFLPFEGQGAISTWRLELPDPFRPFDYDTIADVVLHLRYTARPGGDQFRRTASGSLQALLKEAETSPLARMFSLRHELPGEWHRFRNPAGPAGDQTLDLTLEDRFPLMFKGRGTTITVTRADVLVRSATDTDFTLALRHGPSTTTSWTVTPSAGLWTGTTGAISVVPDAWKLTAWRGGSGSAHERLAPGEIADVLVVCHYTVGGGPV